MANTLGNYNEIFFAQEAIALLYQRLGLGGRIYRGLAEQFVHKGDTAKLRRPSSFVVNDAGGAVQDIVARGLDVTIGFHKEVKFALTDKDFTLSNEQIISDHITPAVYALSKYIDAALGTVIYQATPWYKTITGGATSIIDDLTDARAILFNNAVDTDALNGMVGGITEAKILKALYASGMQPNQQDPALRTGSMGQLLGIDFWANQNTPRHTSGVAADFTGAVNNGPGYAAGVQTMAVNGLTAAATLKIGDIMLVTGHTQQYVVTADAVADGAGAIAALSFAGGSDSGNKGLESAVVNAQVVTFILLGAAKQQNLIFHRDVAALCVVPLPNGPLQNKAANVAAVTDEKSNLSLRAAMWWDPGTKKTFVALDIMFGYAMLDSTKSIRLSE